MTPALVKLEPPRWPGGPPICPTTNLLAHATEADARTFLSTIMMAERITKLWLCDACAHFHHRCKPPAPSGESSGTARKAWTRLKL